VPELPEVEALTRYLFAEAEGAEIARVDVAAISALKTFDPPIDALVGQRFTRAERRGKHLEFQFGDLWLVIHLARGGWVRLVANVRATPVKPGKGPLALRVVFTDGTGFDVTEAGTEKRLAVWVARDPNDIDNVATLGPDPLDDEFTAAKLGELLASAGRAQIKKALTDQRLIAGVGNAYSDEALHIAKLSPFKPSSSLTDDEVGVLHRALVGVLRDAVERSVGLVATDLKREKKEGMRVHGRTGQKCPECGDVVREVSFSSKSLQYCATCQTGGKPLADRRYSKFLK
jgi:DNA-formamidopyrimidine glycosylase